METILKVLGEKIEALEFDLKIKDYQLEELKKQNKELEAKLNETKEVQE